MTQIQIKKWPRLKQYNFLDLSTKLKDIDSKAINPNSLKLVKRVNLKKLNIVKGKPRLGVPVSDIGKIVCIGLNYVDHAKEVGAPLPKEPIIFLKPTSSLSGPNDEVMLPKGIIPKKGKILILHKIKIFCYCFHKII